MSVVKIRHLIEKRFVEIGDLEEKLEIATTMDHSNIKNKITTYKACIIKKISMIAKNDRTYVLAGSSKARHGSRLITVLPYTVTVLIHVC